jgi:hypothetical protein
MRCRGVVAALAVLAAPWIAGPPACAAGRVELELVTDGAVPITAQQEWLRRLTQAGVSNLRIRAGQASDRTAIERRGPESAPTYVVTGIITSADEVVVPGARFRAAEARRLAQWLDDLAQHGPPGERPQRSAFGLTADELAEVHQALSGRVGFSTKGIGRREAIERIGNRLPLPLRVETALLRAIRDDDTVEEELSDLTCGTALAAVVRPLGYALVPRQSSGGLECTVTAAGPDAEVWPVGWESDKKRGELLPGQYEFLNVNVQDVPVTKVLDAVAARLEVPVLMDHNALARHGIEPEKALVSLPSGRTSYALLLKRSLLKAGLKSELRVDEADKVFLWVTTVRPL